MINYYQPSLEPFLGRKKNVIPKGIRRYYYLSFEDAFWHLLAKKHIPKRSLFLFPNFYCMDVLKNVRRHGYSYALYPVDASFQTDEITLLKAIKKTSPSVVVIFHACGITNALMKKKKWMNSLPKKTLVIEDCVHRLVNPSEIKIVIKNHFIIDSLRKVSPLPGSFLYGKEADVDFNPPRRKTTIYSLSSRFFYTLFRRILELGFKVKSRRLVSYAHTMILKMHDDIIGNNFSAHPGLSKNETKHSFIDFEKIKKLKKEQVQSYEYNFYPVMSNNKIFKRVQISESDYSSLHVYPLEFLCKSKKKLISYLHNNNIVVWDKFPDSPWSKKQSVLFFPLGFHMNEKNIRYIAHKLEDYTKLN